MLPAAENINIVLASKSPRRQQLIAALGFPFRCVSVSADEVLPAGIPADEASEYLARLKASAFDCNSLAENDILVTADTVVVADGRVLGKPADRDDAWRMLSLLSGRCHVVHTGVCLTTKTEVHSFTESTKVYFNHLEDNEIEYYLDNFKYIDKAGSYGIQDWIGYIGVERVEGCFYNVVGLPVSRLYREIKQLMRKS